MERQRQQHTTTFKKRAAGETAKAPPVYWLASGWLEKAVTLPLPLVGRRRWKPRRCLIACRHLFVARSKTNTDDVKDTEEEGEAFVGKVYALTDEKTRLRLTVEKRTKQVGQKVDGAESSAVVDIRDPFGDEIRLRMNGGQQIAYWLPKLMASCAAPPGRVVNMASVQQTAVNRRLSASVRMAGGSLPTSPRPPAASISTETKKKRLFEKHADTLQRLRQERSSGAVDSDETSVTAASASTSSPTQPTTIERKPAAATAYRPLTEENVKGITAETSAVAPATAEVTRREEPTPLLAELSSAVIRRQRQLCLMESGEATDRCRQEKEVESSGDELKEQKDEAQSCVEKTPPLCHTRRYAREQCSTCGHVKWGWGDR